MFQFNFNIEEVSKNADKEEEKTKVETSKVIPAEAAEEITSEGFSIDDGNLQCTLFISRDMEISMLDSVGIDNGSVEETHSDLIPGTYEGGFKVWECTQDLADYLLDSPRDDINGKVILDLGCGAGILGIIALKLGASKCHFQDYNKDVLQKFTIPNVLLNAEADEKVSIGKCQFYSGDWASYSEVTVDTKFDTILTSETIYNPENNQKVIDLFMGKLKRSGKVILAAKTYYFGVGGGLRQFEELLRGKMVSTSVWKNCDGVTREIIKIEHINA